MNTITVCVDMADILAITLPYNRHHWNRMLVVTSLQDEATKRFVSKLGDRAVSWYATDAFYRDGAAFNKWKALEEGLDVLGREGWLCLMDCDVLWPKSLWGNPSQDWVARGYLYTPRRRMWTDWPSTAAWPGDTRVDPDNMVPDEAYWHRFPLHPQQQEFAGYSQIFHASDPVLGPPPWHQIDWAHCGGADSFFQAKWPENRKVRPPFEVLHLGPAGQNWCGRATPYRDGTLPPDAERRRQQVRAFIHGRTAGPGRFDGEKVRPGG